MLVREVFNNIVTTVAEKHMPTWASDFFTISLSKSREGAY